MNEHHSVIAYGTTLDYQVWSGVQTPNQLDLSKVNQKNTPGYLQLLELLRAISKMFSIPKVPCYTIYKILLKSNNKYPFM